MSGLVILAVFFSLYLLFANKGEKSTNTEPFKGYYKLLRGMK